MKGLVSEFLLADLAGRGFLPGYGFPTNIVNFDNQLYDDEGRTKAFRRSSEDGPEPYCNSTEHRAASSTSQ